MAKTRTVITAPPRPARPAQKPAPAPALQAEPAQPPALQAPPESSAARPDQHAADLEALQAVEQRLADGLAGVQEKQTEHSAALERIASALQALPGRVEEAELHLERLQQEQSLLPRKINAAKALLIGASGTPAEGHAQTELAALQARQETLPPDLEQAEQAEHETRAACEQERARLEQERDEHTEALADLAEFAKALQEEGSRARRRIAEAVYASIEAEQQQRQAALDAAEASVAEARAALSALAEEAKTRLQQTAPDLLLQFQAAHVPVQDAVTERLEAVLVYRRALLAWQKSGNQWLNFPMYWFPFRDTELGMPDIQRMFMGEIEKALSKHIAEQQQRIR